MEINEIVKTLLNMRGITSEEAIIEFLSDKPRLTYEPELMPDIEAGARLILEEIEAGGKICIYGDYDADGITSTTLMLSILGHLMPSDRLTYYIPSRFDEGYGLNIEAINHVKAQNVTMIVTVDCGSVSLEEVEYAKSLGLKIIVTDHHNITDKMSDCLLINPKRPDSQYPFKELSGCGVAFKLAQMIQKLTNLPKSVLTEVLDLVAIGTIGDIMPLVDENRTLVKFGLRVINTTERPGLVGLMDGASLKQGNVSADNVGYIIVPHLNASGRMEDASLAVKLLSANKKTDELNSIVDDLLFKNQERKRIQSETYKRALEIMGDELEDFNIVRVDDAHEGIIGIVAGKLKDDYNRPTIIVTPIGEEKTHLKGTGRSIDGVNLHEILNRHAELFDKFGGHSGACGFTMPIENLDALRDALISEMKELVAENDRLFEKSINVDLDLDFYDINIKLAEDLSLLAPFGTRNPKPVFRLMDVMIKDVKYMGADSQHVRFNVVPEFEEGPSRPIQCVIFNKAQNYRDKLINGTICDLVGSVESQVWQGQTRVQFITTEIEFLD